MYIIKIWKDIKRTGSYDELKFVLSAWGTTKRNMLALIYTVQMKMSRIKSVTFRC